MKPSLSALIIAKDEARDLPACLASVRDIAEEIVVVVDASTSDATESVAAAAGCKVIKRAFDDYASQRQAALALCTGQWVIWIDADESADAALRGSILRALAAPKAEAYPLAFKVSFLGRTLRFGGLGSETHIRVFRRDKARFVGGALHEGLAVDGRVASRPLDGRMLHAPYRDLSDYLAKLDRYTSLAARKKLAAGQGFHWWHHAILPWELVKRLFLRLAILDGSAGIAYAFLSAFHHWLKYVKLREMERAA